jgi:GT2 family glycosyltransferase/glycosyltransferase involved in cell wall biosynthesis
MNRRSAGIDIIIPVYNGYDDMILCMESIQKYTDLTKHRIILVNDKSPDERILPLLQSYVADGIELIDSKENEGFSASVNKGMQYSTDKDVILLNSDTIVTRGWVEKIQKCAYSKREIGTVTPLSNAATLCSYPVFCQDNCIPADCTIDELADVVERSSFHHYPQITVAVGFCMFIKREVIDAVGLFDAKTFERGYGEENDFCNRAEQMGYIHVMCDDTFIYHKGTASFASEEKQKLIEAHDKILNERYADQMRTNHMYCITNPDQYIRDNIDIYRMLQNGKKNILYLNHLDFREDAYGHVGGTQFHIKDLTTGLCKEHNIIVAARDREYLKTTIYIGEEHLDFDFYIGKEPAYVRFFDKRIGEILRAILQGFQVDLVHVHHTSTLSLDIYYEAHKLGIPVIATLHDYYYVCPTIKLMDSEMNCCCQKVRSMEACDRCLWQQGFVASTVPYMKHWRAENGKALALCERLIFPSESAKNIFAQYYPELENKMVSIPHGLTPDKIDDDISGAELCSTSLIDACFDYCFDHPVDRNLVMGWACLEHMDSKHTKTYIEVKSEQGEDVWYSAEKKVREDVKQIKGSNYLYSGFSAYIPQEEYAGQKIEITLVIESNGIFYKSNQTKSHMVPLPENRKYDLRVAFIGGMVPEKGSVTAKQLVEQHKDRIGWYVFGAIGDEELANYEQNNFVKVGTYPRERLTQLLSAYEIDVVCILSNWPETFCYTLSEAVLAHIPVIGVDIGAIGERLDAMGCGWKVSNEHTVEEITNLLARLLDNPDMLQKKKQAVLHTAGDSVEDMLERYRALYRGFGKKQDRHPFADYEALFKGYVKYTGQGFTGTELDARIRMDRELSETKNTIGSLKGELKVLNEEMSTIYQELNAKNEELNVKNEELNAIYASRWYKLVCRLKKRG